MGQKGEQGTESPGIGLAAKTTDCAEGDSTASLATSVAVSNDANDPSNGFGNKVVPYGITSLLKPWRSLRLNEPVQFRLAVNVETGAARAVQIASIGGTKGKKYKAKVANVKGDFGFLAFDPLTLKPTKGIGEGSTASTTTTSSSGLFFHRMAIEGEGDGGGRLLNAGDEVEFTIEYSSRTQKYSAQDLRLLTRASVVAEDRPQRLKMNLQAPSSGALKNSMVHVRQPVAPDGILEGFTLGRGRPQKLAAPVLNPAAAFFTPGTAAATSEILTDPAAEGEFEDAAESTIATTN